MNYQVFPLIFMRITTLLFFFIAVGLNFLGVSALICYFVLVGVAFPIAISMRLHRLNESGLALTLTENSQWLIYLYPRFSCPGTTFGTEKSLFLFTSKTSPVLYH